jgi:RNA polymerase sigma-70 factor (ECF subfamily)
MKNALGDDLPDEHWELIDRYRGELVNQALAILGNLQDAEDVVQESFCEAFSHPERLEEARSIGALLRAINKANALNRLRFRYRDADKNERRQREAPRRMVTTGGISILEVRDSVAQAVEGLSAKHRAVVVMRYWEHCSNDEIARRLGIPVGSVGRLHYEATQHLFGKLHTHLQAAPDASHSSPSSE